MATAKGRKRFLNDFCEQLGIYDRSDIRRSQAAQAHQKHGEKNAAHGLQGLVATIAGGRC